MAGVRWPAALHGGLLVFPTQLQRPQLQRPNCVARFSQPFAYKWPIGHSLWPAVVLAVSVHVYRTSNPQHAVIGRIPGTDSYRQVRSAAQAACVAHRTMPDGGSRPERLLSGWAGCAGNP